MEINSIIKNLLTRYPLFGNIIANLNFEFTNENVPAPAFTDGKNIYYKQDFLDDYSDDEKEFIIAHEIFHIVLKHFFRNSGRDEDLLNFVEDGIINQLLSKDGMTMPESVVNIPDALEYSTEELYMKYLPQLKQIKDWMNTNTYHIEIKDLNELIDGICNDNIENIINVNIDLRNELLSDFKAKLKMKSDYETKTLGIKLPVFDIGTGTAILCWRELLKENLASYDELIHSIYEVEKDGIIKKEEKNDISYCESEIIVDSSGSMEIRKIKTILRECKNILLDSQIKVGFCDDEFYGWNDINNNGDIDNLEVIGGFGTDFEAMVNSFSSDCENKIIITDGFCDFPKNCSDVLWIIINDYLPGYLTESPFYKDINYIFVNESELEISDNNKVLVYKENNH